MAATNINKWNIILKFPISTNVIEYELNHMNNKEYKSRYKDKKKNERFVMKISKQGKYISASSRTKEGHIPLQYWWDNINKGHKLVFEIGGKGYATIESFDIQFSSKINLMKFYIGFKRKHDEHNVWVTNRTRSQHKKILAKLEHIVKQKEMNDKQRKKYLKQKMVAAKEVKRQDKILKQQLEAQKQAKLLKQQLQNKKQQPQVNTKKQQLNKKKM